MSSTKDVKEVKGILKSVKKDKSKLPPKEKNILDWNASELNAYILKTTKGMSITKKIKFAKKLDKRIKDEKKARKSS